jgi:hypothetical protein
LCFSSDGDDDENAELDELQEFLGPKIPVFETLKSGYCVEEVLSQYVTGFGKTRLNAAPTKICFCLPAVSVMSEEQILQV